MIKRPILNTIAQRLTNTPAVVLLGARQVGKTTLARNLAAGWPGQSLYLDMERPADRRRLEDADSFLRAQRGKLVVIDEIHRLPGLFEVLRGVIDQWRYEEDHGNQANQANQVNQPNQKKGQTNQLKNSPSRFLLLGSAGIELMQQSSETLAGRVAYIEINPLTFSEVQSSEIDLDTYWLRGGFPLSLLAPTDTESLNWRRDFIRSYLERDVPMFAPRLSGQAIGRLWRMLAHGQGSLLNQANLASSLGVSGPAVGRYIDLLTDLNLVRQLKPWNTNTKKRLVKSPKVYVRDSGLVHALLEIETLHDLLGHAVCGPSFEGMAIDNLIHAAAEKFTPYFYRTHAGAEIDLLLVKGNQPAIAIEVKRSLAPSPKKGFFMACEELQPAQRFLVYPGADRFSVRHGAQAIGLKDLTQFLQES